MKCCTFHLTRIQAKVNEWLRVGDNKQCANCQEPLREASLKVVTSPTEGYQHECGELICIICGCTENHACEGGCRWIGPGLCSAHIGELNKLLSEV